MAEEGFGEGSGDPRAVGSRGGQTGESRPGDPRGAPWAGFAAGNPWAGQGEGCRGGSTEGQRGRCAPRPAGKGKGRPGEDLDGGQGVSRAGGEELGPGAGPGPPPPVPLPAPLWQLPPVPSPFAPVPEQHTGPPECLPACRPPRPRFCPALLHSLPLNPCVPSRS